MTAAPSLFQSLIGRLKTCIENGKATRIVRFQSLIGRLKTGDMPLHGAREEMFQSLIGRLKTFRFVHQSYINILQKFQSLIGRLKTGVSSPVRSAVSGFNPS